MLDICIRKVGLSHLEPGKGYHFSDGYDVALLYTPFGVAATIFFVNGLFFSSDVYDANS